MDTFLYRKILQIIQQCLLCCTCGMCRLNVELIDGAFKVRRDLEHTYGVSMHTIWFTRLLVQKSLRFKTLSRWCSLGDGWVLTEAIRSMRLQALQRRVYTFPDLVFPLLHFIQETTTYKLFPGTLTGEKTCNLIPITGKTETLFQTILTLSKTKEKIRNNICKVSDWNKTDLNNYCSTLLVISFALKCLRCTKKNKPQNLC